MTNKNVFKLWQSMDDYNQTDLYGGMNEGIDWSIFKNIGDGKISVSNYKPLNLKLKTNKILKKDFIQAPASVYFISETFKNYFDASVFEHSVLLPATINDVPYFAWIFLSKNDCLNREASQLEDFTYNENGEQIPYNFVFDQSKIKDNRFFILPNDKFEVPYCDEIIGRKILASDLNIMAQPLLFEEKDVRKRVHYHHPIVGIEFEEPKDWHLECKQLSKIKHEKKLTDKDWAINLKNAEVDISLLSMYRKQLLISTNWLQKAEIHIGLTNRSADAIFTERSAIKPIEFQHDDLKFECRINEYEWEKTLIAPYKEGLSLYIIIVNRTYLKTDEVYKNEALEVIKNMRFTYNSKKNSKPLISMSKNLIIALEKNHYKKDGDIRCIEVEITQPTLNQNIWECTLIMKGYGNINQTLYGQTSMQALSFAMQHAKLNLNLMIADGYFYFDKEENKIFSKDETLKLLNATYGVGTMLDDAHTKAIHLQVINRLLKANGTEEEQNDDMDYLKKEFLDPKIIDYFYHHKPELTALEIYEKAVNYKAIQL